MNELLAAAFGIAANQISRSLLELYEAYDNLTNAGVKLNAYDKAEFDRETKKIREIVDYLFGVELGAMVDRMNHGEKD